MAPEHSPDEPLAPVRRVLIIEDLASDFRLLARHLQREGLGAECRHAPSAEAVEQALAEGGWQLVLTDHQMPGIHFDSLLQRLRRALPQVPIILVSGTIGEELAVDLLHQGVSDFVFKDRMGRLVPAIQRCLDEQRRRELAAAGTRALADSEAFNRTIIGSLGDGLFVAQDDRFVFANPALPAMLGLTLMQFIGSGFDAIVAPVSLPQWRQRFAQRIQPDLPEPTGAFEVAFQHQAGHLLWMELRAARFEYHGRPAVLGLLRDMSERRQFIAELEQHRHHLEALVEERTQKAEAANRAKSAFLANVSHEIRTPLNAITGMVHLLLRDIVEPTHRQRLRTVDDAARHLLSLVNDVLDLSKIESGKLTLEWIDFELDALLERTCALVSDKVRDKGLRFDIDNQALGARLCGDPTRLSQLLLNLLSNAVKFTEHGGLRLSCRVVPDADGQPWLHASVTDTGIGIAADRLSQLFSAFEQADSSTTRRYGGTGLGLAISRHLAQQMDGDIRVHSVLGQGSEFSFQVKLRPAEQGLQAKPAPGDAVNTASALERMLRARHPGARVLLAEDNAINQLVASTLLQEAGLWVDVADNGAQAVALAGRHAYAAILMDVQMPELDGLEAARALRQAGHDRVPILAMTANAFAEDRAACVAAGMNDHIAKPVVPERLYELLLRWLDASHPGTTSLAESPDADAQALLARLMTVPGLQATLGLQQYGQRPDLYRQGLARFCATQAQDMGWMQTPSKTMLPAPRAALRAQLHRLVVATSGLGATGLSMQAQSLEAQLGSGDERQEPLLVTLLAELRQRLAQLLRDIDACLQLTPGASP